MRHPRSDIRILAVGDRFQLIDPYGVSPTRTVSELELAIFHALAAKQPSASIRKLAESHGLTLTHGELDAFAHELDDAGLFGGPRMVAARDEAVRRAVVDGTLVVGGRHDVGQLCRGLLDDARAENERELGPATSSTWLEGCLSPHGDLENTGAVAARAYALLTAERWPDVFVIIGTSHYGGRPAISFRDVHTPLGTVRCHREFASRLQRLRPELERDAPEFVAEHSWRQDLPLLQTVARDLGRELRIIPILIGGLDDVRAQALGRAISQLAFSRLEHACLIASGDLTHFGAGYGWRPPWLTASLAVDAVVGAIRDHEQPVLDAIAARDHVEFAQRVRSTSFCARSQVSALMEHVTAPGQLLARRSIVNWQPYDAPVRRSWAATDAMFNAASLVFARGMPDGDRRATIRACANLVVRRERDRFLVIHRCTLASHEIPLAAWPLVQVLSRGVVTTASAAAITGFDPAEVGEFVDALERVGLLHTPEPPSLHAPRSVAARAPRGLRGKPFLRSEDLRRSPVTLPGRRGYTVRHSSSSSGRSPVTTAVEDTVRDERTLAEVLVQPEITEIATVHINRPANLSLDRKRMGWPRSRSIGRDLLLTPGANPSAVDDAVWQRVIELILRFDPDHLEGDPAYLAALAHQCLVRRVVFPKLTAVFAGHGYAWQVYRGAIQAGFCLEPIVRYHSSELGEIAIGCHLGRLHLLELHILYEIIAGGRPVRRGQLGELVATTLDTRIRPLVRYATGDVVRLVATACECGKPFRIIEFAGRVGDLIPDARGRPITYPEIDATIGAPPGMRFFQLSVTSRDAALTVAPRTARDLCDPAALQDRLGELLHRRIRLRFEDTLHVPEGAKPLALRTSDHSRRWHRRFLG